MSPSPNQGSSDLTSTITSATSRRVNTHLIGYSDRSNSFDWLMVAVIKIWTFLTALGLYSRILKTIFLQEKGFAILIIFEPYFDKNKSKWSKTTFLTKNYWLSPRCIACIWYEYTATLPFFCAIYTVVSTSIRFRTTTSMQIIIIMLNTYQ
jgi:hypothetical protein